MRNLLKLLKYLGIIWGFGGVLICLFVVFNKAFFNTSFIIDTTLASEFGSFFGGFVGTIFSVLSLILIIYAIINQNLDNKKNTLTNNFFKMVDYHNENVKQISIPNIYTEKNNFEKERRAFVIYKIQIKRIVEAIRKIIKDENLKIEDSDLIDISYIIFFYGLDRKWSNFIEEKLKKHKDFKLIVEKLLDLIEANPKIKIGRTNQTNLSTYFRNMYNAIKLVDNSDVLSFNEKKELIKIYRAQLSNPELYVLFFNLVSRFGKKWIERDFVCKYRLIKNIPKDYCDGFDPKDYFSMTYEYEEI